MSPIEGVLEGLLESLRPPPVSAGEEHGRYDPYDPSEPAEADGDATSASPPWSASPASSDTSSSSAPSATSAASASSAWTDAARQLVDGAVLEDVWADRLAKPVLDEVPVLGAVLAGLGAADRALVAATVRLAELLESGEIEARTGVSPEVWVALVARQTRMDRRTLLRAARTLTRLPALRTALVDGRVSFAQLRAVTIAVRQAPRELDEPLDRLVARLTTELADADPDVLGEQIRAALVEWEEAAAPPAVEDSGSWLALQPHLDGTGGKVSGELDAVGFALLDAATAPTRSQLGHHGGAGGARAANLLGHLAGTGGPTTSEAAATSDPAALSQAGAPSGAALGPAAGQLPVPRLLIRATLDTLLDVERTPVELLTTLTGGTVRTTATTARRIVDGSGADLRLVIVGDDGVPLGVGRHTRIPPGWLSDVLATLHDTCTGPLCTRSARGAETDHALPWWPVDEGPGGTTDVANLGPLCGSANRAKETAGWRADQQPDGRRRWTHPRTGLTVTTVPGTWRPRVDPAPSFPVPAHRCDSTVPTPPPLVSPPEARGGPPLPARPRSEVPPDEDDVPF